MDAKVKIGIAQLEEFLQEKYVEISSTEEMTYNSLDTPLEKLHSVYHDWFYSHGSYNYVIHEYSYMDSEGNSKTDFLTIYLINKKELAKVEPEIAENLIGGDANNNDENAYLNFQDVYGVTSNLKVFYCSNGLDDIIGANYADSEKFDSTKTIYPKDTGIAKAVSSALGKSEAEDLTLSELRSVKELTINGTDGISDLSSLYDLTSLNKLTLVNYKGSLEGIGYARTINISIF